MRLLSFCDNTVHPWRGILVVSAKTAARARVRACDACMGSPVGKSEGGQIGTR